MIQVLATDGLVSIDTGSGAKQLVLPDATLLAGLPLQLKKISTDGNIATVYGFSGPPQQNIDGSPAIVLSAPNDAIFIRAIGAAGWKIIGGTGTPINPANVTPGAVSIQSVSVLPATSLDANGNQQVQITVIYTPPNPLANFAGVWVYLDAPDSAGGLTIADGTLGADGTTPAIGTFQPTSEGFFPYNSASFQVVFFAPSPTANQLWRVYLVAGSASVQVFPVQYGQPGASPSQQFLVDAPQSLGLGVEAASLVTDAQLSATPSTWSANPQFTVAGSGDQYWQVAIQWTWLPPGLKSSVGPLRSSLAGVTLILDNNKGTQANIASITVGSPSSYIAPAHTFAVPPGTTNYTIWLLSYNQQGQTNSLIQGVTPSVTFSVTRSLGPVGEEYCALVSPDANNDPYVTASGVSAADGTQQQQVNAQWTSPSDPQFGGAQIVVLKNDGKYYVVGAGTLSPLQEFIPPPVGAVNWAFYLRSVDINGRTNSITPAIVIAGTGGSGAVFAAVVTNGVLTSCLQLAAGAGYPGGTTATLVDSTGTAIPGVSLTPNLSGGTVASITINTAGSGIVATPLNVISVGSNTGLLNLAQSNSATFSAQFAVVAGAFTVNALNAGIITTGVLKVGNNGSGYPIELEVFDHVGSLIGWIGDDTGVSTFVGAWFKQCRIGGANPSAAPLVADSSGNLTITGATLSVTGSPFTVTISPTVGIEITGNSITTTLNNETASIFSRAVGLLVTNGTYSSGVDHSSAYFWDSGGSAIIGDTIGGGGGYVQLENVATRNSVNLDVGGTNGGELLITGSSGGVSLKLGYFASGVPSLIFNGAQILTVRQTGVGSPSGFSDSVAQTYCQKLYNALSTHGLLT